MFYLGGNIKYSIKSKHKEIHNMCIVYYLHLKLKLKLQYFRLSEFFTNDTCRPHYSQIFTPPSQKK